jgi:hypothetical protein
MEQDLRVRVLGGAELAVSGHPLVELASAKAAALLVYLAVTGTGHSRSALAGLFWSDLPEQTARANLRIMERERLDEVAAVELLRLQAQIEDQPIRAVAERLLSRPRA